MWLVLMRFDNSHKVAGLFSLSHFFQSIISTWGGTTSVPARPATGFLLVFSKLQTPGRSAAPPPPFFGFPRFLYKFYGKENCNVEVLIRYQNTVKDKNEPQRKNWKGKRKETRTV